LVGVLHPRALCSNQNADTKAMLDFEVGRHLVEESMHRAMSAVEGVTMERTVLALQADAVPRETAQRRRFWQMMAQSECAPKIDSASPKQDAQRRRFWQLSESVSTTLQIEVENLVEASMRRAMHGVGMRAISPTHEPAEEMPPVESSEQALLAPKKNGPEEKGGSLAKPSDEILQRLPGTVGSRVWVQSDSHGWCMREVMEVENEEHAVLVGGHVFSPGSGEGQGDEAPARVAVSKTFPVDPSHYEDLDNLADMDTMHTAPLLDIIRRRCPPPPLPRPPTHNPATAYTPPSLSPPPTMIAMEITSHRYQADKIYTRTADVLISINPYTR
jgi:hypothetical protein